ncbi:hypothetical protein RO3G_14150 [Lichtheimia corymbifera JMRC:FSU:9682]|uniref:DUF202 domain-containing protein n=1 Tax=Lichtheimia corymbifera JMRC:FSU:9682 TaxID=1263082 RepID=A0A068SC91_9FUNG|nr:hypothetical protein RO3G_14150 [Lichtheimia corymbifera JMRC:FSU:9682]
MLSEPRTEFFQHQSDDATSNSERVATDSFDADRVHEFPAPFLVRTKSRLEKESLHRKYQNQQQRMNNPYRWVQRLYEKLSFSAILENKSAVARDHLANERTFLAWLRTSLAMVTVGVAITQLYSMNPQGNVTAGRAIGATFVMLSVAFLYLANVRYFHSQLALIKDQFPASRGAIMFGSSAALASLIAMFVVIMTDNKS